MMSTQPLKQNPIEQYREQFFSVKDAADAAGLSTEMLRKMRRKGYVPTRDRAVIMAKACGNRISAARLLAVDEAA